MPAGAGVRTATPAHDADPASPTATRNRRSDSDRRQIRLGGPSLVGARDQRGRVDAYRTVDGDDPARRTPRKMGDDGAVAPLIPARRGSPRLPPTPPGRNPCRPSVSGTGGDAPMLPSRGCGPDPASASVTPASAATGASSNSRGPTFSYALSSSTSRFAAIGIFSSPPRAPRCRGASPQKNRTSPAANGIGAPCPTRLRPNRPRLTSMVGVEPPPGPSPARPSHTEEAVQPTADRLSARRTAPATMEATPLWGRVSGAGAGRTCSSVGAGGGAEPLPLGAGGCDRPADRHHARI